MIPVIVLDSGPLSLLANPNMTAATTRATRWAVEQMLAGSRLVVPSIADYEVRRELERAGKTASLTHLDAFNSARGDRYIPLTDDALRLAAKLWAQARNAGVPTADPKELDCDALIAAQGLTLGVAASDIIAATTNPGHLTRFVRAARWDTIPPSS